MSSLRERAQLWVCKAESDLLNIRNNLAAAEVPWDTVCFHAQQAAEKLLKAVLTAHGKTPPRIHDLVALLAACVELEPDLTSLENDCRALTTYATAARYPLPMAEPSAQDGQAMAAAAGRVRAQVLGVLKRC